MRPLWRIGILSRVDQCKSDLPSRLAPNSAWELHIETPLNSKQKAWNHDRHVPLFLFSILPQL